jgi:hypothetical protein
MSGSALTSAASADALVISRTKTEKDLKLSEALLIAGVVMYVVYFGLAVAGALTSSFFNGLGVFILTDIISGLAGVFILVGAIFTAVNWSLLRKPRALPPS